VTAADIARALGGAYRSGAWWRCRCPVHRSDSPTLALRDGDRELVVHCHAGCRGADIFAELRRRELIGDHEAGSRPIHNPKADADRRRAEAADRQRGITEALDAWGESYPADATPQVRQYLASRGITRRIPSTIRLLGMSGWYGRHPSGERRPQMIGLVEHVEHGPVGVSRTFLAVDGSQKATLDPVRLFRGPVGGGAVRLGTVRPDRWLVIAEGIETCLAAMQATGLPGWAALSAGGIERLVLPPEARMIVVAADHDPNGRGERAARIAAERWLAEDRRVRVAMPSEPGTDWADVLVGHGYVRVGEARRDAA